MSEQASRSMGVATVRRLPLYLRELRARLDQEDAYISGAVLAQGLNLDPISVRKDLAATGVVGTPRKGFPVEALIEAIENALGWNNVTDAFLVGAGHLGKALLGYPGFRHHGLSIVAAFDVDRRLIGSKISGVKVFHVRDLSRLARRMHIQIGILTVGGACAQAVADVMVAAGIRGIWNFTPASLRVPAGVVVQREDLAASLAVLSHRLAEATGGAR